MELLERGNLKSKSDEGSSYCETTEFWDRSWGLANEPDLEIWKGVGRRHVSITNI